MWGKYGFYGIFVKEFEREFCPEPLNIVLLLSRPENSVTFPVTFYFYLRLKINDFERSSGFESWEEVCM